MNNIEFETDNVPLAKSRNERYNPGGLVGFLMHFLPARMRNERIAKHILLGITIAIVLLSVFLFSKENPNLLPPSDLHSVFLQEGKEIG